MTWVPNINGRNLGDALAQYRDSAPGLVMFIFIIVGLSLALIFFARLFIKEGVGTDKIFPILTATLIAALFFIASALAVPLAFTADASPATLLFGPLATLLFTLPVMFIDYTPKQTATDPEIVEKAQKLMDKLKIFQGQIENVKENIPVDVSSPEGKMLVIKDSLEDTMKKSAMHFYEPADLIQKIEELEKLNKNIDGLEPELNNILAEYQIFVNCEFSNWIGKFNENGLNLKSTVDSGFQKEMPLDARIEAIKQILESGRVLSQ